jgi:ABC-type proline/glycine betaine transport system permease subunit
MGERIGVGLGAATFTVTFCHNIFVPTFLQTYIFEVVFLTAPTFAHLVPAIAELLGVGEVNETISVKTTIPENRFITSLSMTCQSH